MNADHCTMYIHIEGGIFFFYILTCLTLHIREQEGRLQGYTLYTNRRWQEGECPTKRVQSQAAGRDGFGQGVGQGVA